MAGPTATMGITSMNASNPGDPISWRSRFPPDFALGAHTASLGLAYVGVSARLPITTTACSSVSTARGTAGPHSGYKVIFVPFENGKPQGNPVDVLTGFSKRGRRCLRTARGRRTRQAGRTPRRR